MFKRTYLPILALAALALCLAAAFGAAKTQAAWWNAPVHQPDSLIACGTLSGNTTWALADSPVVVECDVIVPAAYTLTVQPGVIVKFQEPVDELLVYGRLLAVGTAAQPVVFTSLKDDLHGGDTNGDGSASSPAAGDWGGIRIYPGSVISELGYAWIGYGGSGSLANLELRTSQVQVHDNTVAYSSWAGIYVKGVTAGVPLDFQDNQFVSNAVWPIFADPSGIETSFSFSGNTSQGSQFNGFGIYGSLESAVTYTGQPDFPVVIYGDVTINTSAALTLTQGSVIKFQDAVDEIIAYGPLTAVGSAEQPVVFTSLKDDLHGGDTNGDGSTSSPAAGDWTTIRILSGSAGSRIENAWIAYGGSGGTGLVQLAQSDAVLQNSLLRASTSNGVQVSNAAPSILHNLISEASYAGVFATNSAQPLLRENVIMGNGEYGVYNYSSAVEVDAVQNYWGSPSGPYHPATNPFGSGNRVSDHVRYVPWLERPPADLLLLDEVLVGVKGGTWFHPGETTQIQVFYANFTENTIQDAVLVARLPMVATYVSSQEPEGTYWRVRHEVFWKLGTVNPGASGSFMITLKYLWGLPDEFHDGSSVLFAGSNLYTDLFAVQPYLNYSPVVVSGRVDLQEADITALRQSNPDLDKLYTQAISEGYRYGAAFEYSFQSGTPQTRITMLHPGWHAVRFLIVESSQAYAVDYQNNQFSIYDNAGGLDWDLETSVQTYSGSWADSGDSTTCSPQGGGCCLKNCLKTGLGEAAIGRLSSLANAGYKARTCYEALDSGNLDKIADCATELTDAIPLAGELKTVVACVADCAGDANSHDCTAGKRTCEKSLWYQFLEKIEVDSYREYKCDGGCLGGYANILCALGERCVEEKGCVDCGAKGTGCYNNSFNRAVDPNALYGPSGDLLAGQWVTYTIEYENMGAGAAEGVFVVNTLDEPFDDSTLIIANGGEYYAGTRTLSWYVGQLAANGEPGSGGQISFSVQLKSGLATGTEVSNQAVVHFPSVPEVTPTNLLAGQIASVAAVPQNRAVEAGQPLAIQLSGRAGEGLVLSYELVDQPRYGVLSGTPPALIYTSLANFVGPDTFTFRVSAGGQTSAPAQVMIQVAPWSGDVTPPQIVWTDPTQGESGVAASATPVYSNSLGIVYAPAIRVQFSESVAPVSLSSAFSLRVDGGASVPVSVAYDGISDRALIFPLQALEQGKVYSVTVSGVEDLLGNPMPAAYNWSFSTGNGVRLFLPLVR